MNNKQIVEDFVKCLKEGATKIEAVNQYGEIVQTDYSIGGSNFEKIVAKFMEEHVELKETCSSCKHKGFRYPVPSMYPCIRCVRGATRDYYNVDIDG